MTSPPWPLAAVLPDDRDRFSQAIALAISLGFNHVEVHAQGFRLDDHFAALADAGVFVPSAALVGDPGEGNVRYRRALLGYLELQVADAARLGATCAVLTPESGQEVYYTDACRLLAEYAAGRMVRLAVRPAPATWLPDATAALNWLERVDIPNLGLALAIEGEPVEVQRAGNRLLHAYLRDSIIPPSWVQALQTIGYRGVVSCVGALGEFAGEPR
jgi:sugar phosphate isomerase/epimerase